MLSLKNGALGACITTALVSMNLIDDGQPRPFVSDVNDNDELLSEWLSEDLYSDPGTPPECNWFNSSIVYQSQLCSHFVLSRPSSSPHQSFERARRCAAHFQTSCVLSPEIGLSIPACFFSAPGASEGMRMLIGPRILPHPNVSSVTGKLVRVKVPGSTFGTGTRTTEFNDSINVEYLDGSSRVSRQQLLTGEEAYCVQLLRMAFVPACWSKLD